MACELNKFRHMIEHHQGTSSSLIPDSKKKNHSIYINPYNAEIRCIACKIEIYDFDQYPNDET